MNVSFNACVNRVNALVCNFYTVLKDVECCECCADQVCLQSFIESSECVRIFRLPLNLKYDIYSYIIYDVKM